MTFYVGQKVEHVAWQRPWYLWPFIAKISLDNLKLGQVYTVAAVYNYGFGRKALDLVEAPAPQVFGTHPGWVSFAFRPIVERKAETDIGFAHEILRKASNKAPARVSDRSPA